MLASSLQRATKNIVKREREKKGDTLTGGSLGGSADGKSSVTERERENKHTRKSYTSTCV